MNSRNIIPKNDKLNLNEIINFDDKMCDILKIFFNQKRNFKVIFKPIIIKKNRTNKFIFIKYKYK